MQVESCEWYQCVDVPSMASNGLEIVNLQSSYNLNETITYKCEREGHFFHTNKDEMTFTATCREGNVLEVSGPWPVCVAGKILQKIVRMQASSAF